MAEIRKVGILKSKIIEGVHLVQFDIDTVDGMSEIAFLAVKDKDVQEVTKALSLLYPFEELGSSEKILNMIYQKNDEEPEVV